jgi:anti-anti-sigma factor
MGLALEPRRPSRQRAPRPSFGCSVTHDGPRAVFVVSGELDVVAAPDLRELLSEIMRDARCDQVVLDLEHLDFADSRGLSVLASYAERAERDAIEMLFVNPAPHIAKLLSMAGVGLHVRLGQ